MFSLFLRPEDTSPSTSCLPPHLKHNHATFQTLRQQEPCRQEQHSLFKTKLISSIVSNHPYKCPDAYKSQTLIRAFSLVPHIGSYKHTCTVFKIKKHKHNAKRNKRNTKLIVRLSPFTSKGSMHCIGISTVLAGGQDKVLSEIGQNCGLWNSINNHFWSMGLNIGTRTLGIYEEANTK